MKTRYQNQGKDNGFFTLSILLLLLITVFLINSCKQGEQKDSEEVATDQNEAKFDENNSKENDAEFLVEAATINLEEIELGKLAQTRGQSQEVKDYGKMMVDGHTKSLNDLNALAQSKQITLPQQLNEEGKEQNKDLTEEDAKDFDKKYIDKMVKGHKDAIGKFESAEKDTKDPDIKAWASATLPDLRMHLEHAEAIDKKIK
jgi:putative membrane protein